MAILQVPSLQATEINDVLGHGFALVVGKCNCGVADWENHQSLKIAVSNRLAVMGISVKSVTNKFPADIVTGCILLGEGFFWEKPSPMVQLQYPLAA